MASIDLGTLFQVMQGADKQAAVVDPWAPLSNYGDQLGNLVLQQSAHTNDIGGALAAGLGSGLFGGIFKGLGQDYRTNQHKLAMDALSSVMSGNSVMAPDGLDPSIYEQMKSSGELFNKQRELDKEDERRKVLQLIAADPQKSEAMKHLSGIDALGELGMQPLAANKPAEMGALAAPTDLRSELAGEQSGAIPARPLADFGDLLSQHGIDPSMQYTAPTEARQLLNQKMATLEKSKASQATLEKLSQSKNMIDQLAGLKTKADELYSLGPMNSIAGLSGDSAAAKYNSNVIRLADELAVAFSNTGRQYNIQAIRDDLSTAWNKGPDALKARIDDYRHDLLSSVQNKASDLVLNGYQGAQPFLDSVNSINLNEPSAGANPAAGAGAMPTPQPTPPQPPPGYVVTGFNSQTGKWKIAPAGK